MLIYPYSGSISIVATANPYSTYILYAEAMDTGNPPLTSNGVIVRIDTFTPNDHVLSFDLDISQEEYGAMEENFLQLLTTVYQLTHETAAVKRWCVLDGLEPDM